MTHVSDYTKTSKEILVDLIDADNGISIPTEKLEFGSPAVEQGNLTSVLVTGKPVLGTKGSVKVTYSRVPLAGIKTISTDILEAGAPQISIAQVLALVNAKYGVNIQASDVTILDNEVDGDELVIPLPENAVINFTFKAKPTSFVWLDQVDVPVMAEHYNLTTLISDDAMDGLERVLTEEEITYGEAWKDYVVKHQVLYYDLFKDLYPGYTLTERSLDSSIFFGTVQFELKKEENGVTTYRYVVGVVKNDGGENPDTPFTTLLRAPFEKIIKTMGNRPSDNCELIGDVQFAYLESFAMIPFIDLDTGVRYATTANWSISETSPGSMECWIDNTWSTPVAIPEGAEFIWGKGKNYSSLLIKEKTGNLYNYTYYGASSGGLSQIGNFVDTRDFIATAVVYSMPMAAFVYKKQDHSWGVTCGAFRNDMYVEANDWEIVPEDYPGVENLTQGLAITAGSGKYYGEDATFILMTWNTPDKDCVVKAIEINGSGTAEDPVFTMQRAGYVSSVRDTCGLMGDMTATSARTESTQEGNMIYTVVHPYCDGRPGVPGRGAVSLYNNLYFGELTAYMGTFKPAGDMIAPTWTINGAKRDRDFGKSVLAAYNNDNNVFMLFMKGQGHLKVTTFHEDMTPRPGLFGKPRSAQ